MYRHIDFKYATFQAYLTFQSVFVDSL